MDFTVVPDLSIGQAIFACGKVAVVMYHVLLYRMADCDAISSLAQFFIDWISISG